MFHIRCHVIGENQVNHHVIVWESRVISIDDGNLRKFASFFYIPTYKNFQIFLLNLKFYLE